MNDNYPIIVKTYQLNLWYMQKIAKLPKNNRFTIGEKIQIELLDLLLLYIQAVYSKNKKEIFRK